MKCCEKCIGKCCNNDECVDLFFFEFMRMIKIKPFQYTHRPFMIRMQLPCVFFDPKTQKCSIYEIRPLMCRIFPFKSIEKENNIFITMHPNCPKCAEMIKIKELNQKDFFLNMGMDENEMQLILNNLIKNEAIGLSLLKVLNPLEIYQFRKTMVLNQKEDKIIPNVAMPFFITMPTSKFFAIVENYEKVSEPVFIPFLMETLMLYRLNWLKEARLD